MDDLDAFLDAANPEELRSAAESVAKHGHALDDDAALARDLGVDWDDGVGAPRRSTTVVKVKKSDDDWHFDDDEVDFGGKSGQNFMAVDPVVFTGGHAKEPFVLIPAHVYAYVPRWGWAALGGGLLLLVAALVLAPVMSLNRVASRLGDANEARAHSAMRTLVLRADERTVKKLYSMASSSEEKMRVRLRAVDTMSLIERIPEVDRALLRLELSESTNEQVRQAAILARRNREAVRAGRGAGGE